MSGATPAEHRAAGFHREATLFFYLIRLKNSKPLVFGLILWILAAITVRATPEPLRCSEGVELHLNAPAYGQGGLALLSISSTTPLGDVHGEWNGRKVDFWLGSRPGAPARHSTSRSEHGEAGNKADSEPEIRKVTDKRLGLLGVDLEQTPGEYELVIQASRADREPLRCTANIKVMAGHFATESLHVQPQFVEPNPEQLARAKEESKHLREIFDTATPNRLWQGPFRIPLAGVSSGTNFGKRRILNGQPGSPHSGIDMPAPTGTPVFASQAGRVVLAEGLYFSGNTVVIDHGLGVYTLYGHLSKIDAKVGDLVDTNTVLGRVGATGRVTGPHLHWGLTVNRARVNPLAIVKIF
jgi:murein DD-endopeptidase MepM/ murein hydrolase activator NlpD